MQRWLGILLVAGGCTQETGIGSELPPSPQGVAQPAADTIQVDRFLQVVDPVVDVLFVLDNSGSMSGFRAAMAAAFPDFIAPFVDSGVDFHVGVVSTDMNDETHQGKLREANGVRWLSPDTPSIVPTFQEMATEAIDGTASVEAGLEAALWALELEGGDEGYNAGFFRRDDTRGWLHITVMTDEDDQSDPQITTPRNFIEYLEVVRPWTPRCTFNSIVSLVTEGYSSRGQAYLDVSEATGGAVFPLQGGNWAEVMNTLGGLQAPPARREFFLSRLPVPDTIEARGTDLDGVTELYLPELHYTYDPERNSISFIDDDDPPLGATLEITYTVRAALANPRVEPAVDPSTPTP